MRKCFKVQMFAHVLMFIFFDCFARLFFYVEFGIHYSREYSMETVRKLKNSLIAIQQF